MLDDIKGVSRTRKMKKDRQYYCKKGQPDKQRSTKLYIVK